MPLTFRSAPRISEAQWTRVLTRAGSPVAPLAAALYGIPLVYGLDPAVALAFFARESGYGTTGICKHLDLKNWGMVRTAFDPARGTQLTDPRFFKFTSWADGLTDWCERIVHRYMGDMKLLDVEAALPVYA